ncbi:hypothetical protein A6E15_14445 [Natrinema saccharevitans]|uniref:Uncharacterized protein n=1 Tax=Natrinema saccharevitans TaxID=301967 RepID=A0A1S8B0E7_9EURY|nr:hypothetical protein [Natrinema saccharevitans]OLZ42094.1 hypothetical protein A6E15_14445 [Natrinema saccharevitans]
MSALRAVLFEWDLNRVTRIAVSALAVFLAQRVTDDFLTGLGATIVFLVVLSIPWEVTERFPGRSDGS